MKDMDAKRLEWLKSNPNRGYADLPQNLWDEAKIAHVVALQKFATLFPNQLSPGTVCDCAYPIPAYLMGIG